MTRHRVNATRLRLTVLVVSASVSALSAVVSAVLAMMRGQAVAAELWTAWAVVILVVALVLPSVVRQAQRARESGPGRDGANGRRSP
jgi:hypothetical protein